MAQAKSFKQHYNAYYIDGELYVSVSTILNMESTGDLIGWALSKFGPEENPSQAYKAFMESVSATGTLIHKFVELDFSGKELPAEEMREELMPVFENFFKWKSEHKVECIESEKRCWSEKYRIAGTTDMLAKVDGKLYLIDIKTGSVQPKAFSQLAAYKSFLIEMGQEEVKDAELAVLNLHRDGGKCEFITLEDFYDGKSSEKDQLGIFHALRYIWFHRNVKSKKWLPAIKNMEDIISPLEARFKKAFKL